MQTQPRAGRLGAILPSKPAAVTLASLAFAAVVVASLLQTGSERGSDQPAAVLAVDGNEANLDAAGPTVGSVVVYLVDEEPVTVVRRWLASPDLVAALGPGTPRYEFIVVDSPEQVSALQGWLALAASPQVAGVHTLRVVVAL